jgi:DNA (cytosine-5)-methyltransferase 1
MIEFYHRYFKSNYKSKINQLIIDIERLLLLEDINPSDDFNSYLNKTLKGSLDTKTWNNINKLYSTIDKNKSRISETLYKFVNKNKNNKNSNFKFIDTFAGCGGLSLGLMNVGFNPVLVNDIEPNFLETYYFNHDLHIDNYHCGDIKKIAQKTDYDYDIDLVVGGPPCQGFSMANRQRLYNDPRNKLYKYFLQLLANVKPKFFIMENVKGMMKKSNEILDDYHSILGSEYSIEMVLFNAKDFGIPQNRERVFVIGSRYKNVIASNIISDIIKIKNKSKGMKLKDALFGLPKLEPKREKNSRGVENNKIGYKFTRFNIKTNEFLKWINNTSNPMYLSNHTNRFNNNRDITIFERLPQGANSLHKSIEDIMPYKSRNHIFKDKYFKLNENEVSKTITSHMKMDCNMYIHPKQSRGLSPREASRIQTFPDNFIFMGANNNWYAQIGNAVPVKLAQIIGSQIIKHLN